jgi:hypothetical protein
LTQNFCMIFRCAAIAETTGTCPANAREVALTALARSL